MKWRIDRVLDNLERMIGALLILFFGYDFVFIRQYRKITVWQNVDFYSWYGGGCYISWCARYNV